LRFNLLVHATPAAPVSFAQLSELTSAGTSSSIGTALVTEGTLPAGFSKSSLSVSQVNTAGTLGDFASKTSPFITADFTVTVDLSLTSTSANGLKLTSAKLIFNPAPEPVSASILLVGLVGLGVARRRGKARAGA